MKKKNNKEFQKDLVYGLLYCSRTPENYKLPCSGDDLISKIADFAIELGTGKKGLIQDLPRLEINYWDSHGSGSYRKDVLKIYDLFQKEMESSSLDKQINEGLIGLLKPIKKSSYGISGPVHNFTFTEEYYERSFEGIRPKSCCYFFSLSEETLYKAKNSFKNFSRKQKSELKEIGSLVRSYIDEEIRTWND